MVKMKATRDLVQNNYFINNYNLNKVPENNKITSKMYKSSKFLISSSSKTSLTSFTSSSKSSKLFSLLASRCNLFNLILINLLFVIVINNQIGVVSAKSLLDYSTTTTSTTTTTTISTISLNSNNLNNLDNDQENNNNHQHHHPQQQQQQQIQIKDESCNSVKDLFDAIHIQTSMDHENKGSICGGHCCTNLTENQLKDKSTTNFQQVLRDHTQSLRGILKTTSNLFKSYVLELSHQSENKTLHVFSQVYRRMLPLSRQLIHDLYTSLRSNLISTNDLELEKSVHNFFINLFPVAYHQAVHLNNDTATGDLHQDYINCLKHTFDDLQPFGDIPKELIKNLIKSIQPSTVFIDSLENGADILSKTDDLDSMYLTSSCQTHLLKINYCPGCNGYKKTNTKVCYSYCLNVMRGCLAQYVGVLDSPWSNVAEAIERLVSTSIQSDKGIVNTIKGLDGKLSEAIMRAMENGPELEKKVKKTCGTPKLLPVDKTLINEIRVTQQPTKNMKWATPPEAEIIHFLTTIERSKDFYSKIVDNLCKDDEYQQNDRDCWTGDRIGDYTQTVMSTGVDGQRYNPEVPLVQHSYTQVTKLNELVDKLIKLRSRIVNALPSNPKSYSDIQGDMARHDEEGSGGFRDDLEDDEFNNVHGSGSGDGPTSIPDLTAVSPKTASGDSSGSSSTRISSITFIYNVIYCLVLLKSSTYLIRH